MAEDVTQLLARAGTDPEQRGRLFKVVYDELRRLARRQLGARGGDQTLSTGPLVHEAYMKLFPNGRGSFENRRHFFGAAARAMRQVAIDYARARLAERRGEGKRPLNIDDIDPNLMQLDSRAEELVHLDAAMTQLGEVDARALQVAELRYFGGMEVLEIAEALEVSEATVKRDTRFAREFLSAALAG
ncbi:MAG: sigma-70 family RNA polymerase sigma factor [Xanthomonadales bacterium]|nr:sigma-70 family RNA polymerase sigma factor [Xanthomonadales bacterium]